MSWIGKGREENIQTEIVVSDTVIKLYFLFFTEDIKVFSSFSHTVIDSGKGT